MSGPTFAQVLHFDGSQLHRAAQAWAGLADRVRERAEAMVAPLRSAEQAWQGAAAQVARRRADRLRASVDATPLPLQRHQYVLSDLASGGERLRGHAWELVSRATAAGVRIGADGTVTPAGIDPEFAGRAVASFRVQVDEVLAEAARLDADAIRRLAEDAPWPDGRTHRFVPRSAVPEPGSDPTAVHRWWQGLDPAQQRYLISSHPALVGSLDGVPIADRDQANRALLRQARERLTAHVAELEDELVHIPRAPGGQLEASVLQRQIAAVAATLAALDFIERQLTTRSADGQRSYLVGFDTDGDGRVVLAVGNPDYADNIVTYVPGTGSELSDIAGDVGRTVTMVADATQFAPEQRTAGVYWLDYDAPDTLPLAASRRYARDAADDLRRFADGVRVTGGDAHHTVLGHSYGSTVVGHTASGGLSADSLVFLGSPGVGVDSAADLVIDADPTEHVWSSTAARDPIRFISPTLLVESSAPYGGRLFNRLVGVPDQFHGTDPSGANFGGQLFASDPGGHSGYWDEGNIAREHLARITTGHHHDEITTDMKERP